MPKPLPKAIRDGRALVGVYRAAHIDKTPAGHMPLFDTMIDGLIELGFQDIADFFTQSDAVGDGWK